MTRRRTTIALATTVALIAFLLLAASAGARSIQLYTYTGHSFDGHGSTAGTFADARDIDINQANGSVYVVDPGRFRGSFTQFDPLGVPMAFSGAGGASSISVNTNEALRIAVDNSNTPSHGNIYIDNGRNAIVGFNSEGTALGSPFPLSGFQNSCGMAVDTHGNLWVSEERDDQVVEFTSLGSPTGRVLKTAEPCQLAIDSHDNFYVTGTNREGRPAEVRKYDSEGHFLFTLTHSPNDVAIDPATDDVFVSRGDHVDVYDSEGDPLSQFGFPDPAHSFEGLSFPSQQGVAINGSTHQVYVYSGNGKVYIFAPESPITVPTVTTEVPELTPSHATLKGSVDIDGGGNTTDCHFEWGVNDTYGNSIPCTPAAITTPGVHEVTAELPGLTQGQEYHYRLSAKNGNEVVSVGVDRAFRPQGPAAVSAEIAGEINTDGARLGGDIDPNGGDTSYRVEYGPEDCATIACASLPVPEGQLAQPLGVQHVSVVVAGLTPGTTYHYRIVATNGYGETPGADETFTTFSVDSATDPCANALVRKQTRAVLLPDCRAYELVSAADAGGYDVRSDLIAGQAPLVAKPQATDSVLYSLNFGKVPGVAGEPTNHGSDPYIATRTPSGWQTRYAGIPVGFPPAQASFGSTPSEESANLATLTFGGPEICSPCFPDGKVGIPVSRGGTISQGMAGALDPGSSAVPDGYIARQLSADGTHLVFGSASKFADGAAEDGDVSIYDRDLATGTTHVVSKDPGGADLSCLQGAGACHSPGNPDGIGALDISSDGSRIVVAQRVSTDADGNRYWHPYMNIGDSDHTVDLLPPGAASGVLYDGMTADGSAVYYTSSEQLTSDDHDSSADIFRAAVAPDGTVTVTRVSTGTGAGDVNSCDPVANANGNNWNAVGAASANTCGAVALAGGAGLASGSGDLYFLSPEQLAGSGSGVQNQPNLYLAVPGDPVRFVATLEPGSATVIDAVAHSATHSYGDFQVTPSGAYALFSSNLPLTGFPTFGHYAIYRYSLPGESLACVSCAGTRAGSTSDTKLSPFGSNLANDGRAFFTSEEPLALRDTGGGPDVYEWKEGKLGLVSSGRTSSGSRLLSVSSDGVNVYFFTRDTLVEDDRNGQTVKIYDAREGGGFLVAPSPPACQASDECHGPGSSSASSSSVGTFKGTGGNFTEQPGGKRHHKHKHKRHRHHHKRHHGSNKGGKR